MISFLQYAMTCDDDHDGGGGGGGGDGDLLGYRKLSCLQLTLYKLGTSFRCLSLSLI